MRVKPVGFRVAVPMLLLCASQAGCSALHLGLGAMPHPPDFVGEWIDLRHTTEADTSLWVLRANGYDGWAHLFLEAKRGGPLTARRTETRWGSWYFKGNLADSLHRALCYARRIGRDGASCVVFSLDTIPGPRGPRRRMIVHGYRGTHWTGDRVLIFRGLGS